jgi:hypothetical protein
LGGLISRLVQPDLLAVGFAGVVVRLFPETSVRKASQRPRRLEMGGGSWYRVEGIHYSRSGTGLGT